MITKSALTIESLTTYLAFLRLKLEEWSANSHDIDALLIETSSVTSTSLNLSLRTFIDDVSKNIQVDILERADLWAQQLSSDLDCTMDIHGYAQNHSKRECTAYFPLLSDLPMAYSGNFDLGFCRRETCYLGPVLHYKQAFFPDKFRRTKAASRVFWMLCRFWSSGAVFSFRVSVYWATVLSTLVSGVMVLVLSHTDCAFSDRIIAKHGRVLLKGHATTKTTLDDKTVEYKALSNLDVLKELRIALVSVELTIIRLRWYQQIAWRPTHHDLFLTAMFGTFAFERPNLEPHPWMKQLLADFDFFQSLMLLPTYARLS